jgi:hypothetical protein
VVRLRLLELETVNGKEKSALLSFVGCTWLSIGIDFWNKNMCGDAIAFGEATVDATRAAGIQDNDPPRLRWQPNSELLFFKIVLCPISGEIELLARDFSYDEVK